MWTHCLCAENNRYLRQTSDGDDRCRKLTRLRRSAADRKPPIGIIIIYNIIFMCPPESVTFHVRNERRPKVIRANDSLRVRYRRPHTIYIAAVMNSRQRYLPVIDANKSRL